MNLNINFRNEEQAQFYFSTHRNGCFSGGFNNGKTFVACQRAATMLMLFSNYRYVIARHKYKTLRQTTMQTFLKVVPREFIVRHDEQSGVTVLINQSVVYWMHLDVFNEEDLKGLEINSCLIDQAEEQEDESPILILDARIGRWDKAIVPDHLLAQHPDWPRNDFGEPRVPNYMDILANPNEEIGEFHWVYRWYHPKSPEKNKEYFYIERETDERLGDPGTMKSMKARDPEWVNTYFKGQWGKSNAQIHYVDRLSIINPDEYSRADFDSFIQLIKQRGAIFRILDHGVTGITAVLWAAALNNVHICFQEYYVQGKLISDHRHAIHDLSTGMQIYGDYADPAIFKKAQQKDGAFWTTADEYVETDTTNAEPISFAPADNNELATRNRINELLQFSLRYQHPLTKIAPAPGLYFVLRSTNYPFGCFYTLRQTQAQRRKLIGMENGKKIYSTDRDTNIPDHSYDTLRYYIATHSKGSAEPQREPPTMSFAKYNRSLRIRERLIYTHNH